MAETVEEVLMEMGLEELTVLEAQILHAAEDPWVRLARRMYGELTQAAAQLVRHTDAGAADCNAAINRNNGRLDVAECAMKQGFGLLDMVQKTKRVKEIHGNG